MPAIAPPWGTLNALDLATGQYLWKKTLGHDPRFPNSKEPTGTENYGASVVTAGGLLFIAATTDGKFRAFNKRSGDLLWEIDLPNPAFATPSVYEVNGRQYIVIACGGGKNNTRSGLDLLKKYNELYLVYPKLVPYPCEIVRGFRKFCMRNDYKCEVINEIDFNTILRPGKAFIVIEETDLVNLIKKCRLKKLKIGKEIGIISYNETPLKEILLDGITVISTDHEKMGEVAAELILKNSKEKIKNPFKLIRRKSL